MTGTHHHTDHVGGLVGDGALTLQVCFKVSMNCGPGLEFSLLLAWGYWTCVRFASLGVLAGCKALSRKGLELLFEYHSLLITCLASEHLGDQ